MSAQLSLFATRAEPRAPPSMRKPERREPFPFRKLSDPCGKADARGKYAYEKFHKAAAGIGEPARVKFFEMLQVTDATLFSQMIEIGVLWNKLTVTDQMDYEDAIGLRG